MRAFLGCLAVMGVLAGWLACYDHTPPPRCPNIMTCDDGTMPPPLMARLADGGTDR